jgi:hypothetical protein
MTNPRRGNGEGDVSQQAETHPTKTPASTQHSLEPIERYAPWSSAGEKPYRAALYSYRDMCGLQAAQAEGWPHHVFKTAEDLAGDWIWRRASEDELRHVAKAVGRMIQAGIELVQGGVRNA